MPLKISQGGQVVSGFKVAEFLNALESLSHWDLFLFFTVFGSDHEKSERNQTFPQQHQ